jgi:hypothetical protein
MKQQDVRMLGLLLLPYGVVALFALSTAAGPDSAMQEAVRPSSAPAPAPAQAALQHCMQSNRLDPSEAARLARVEQARRDPLARSQSPGWAGQARAGQEACLRGAL